jgi:NAD(P)-dependent dehydrogenase (short-subunit alcohol dehydrogenase family)
VVIVTGGTSGLGRCIAIDCAKAGARGVLVTGRDAARGEEVRKKINREWTTNGAAFVAVDLGDENAATKIMDAAVAAFGTVDLLVNSAAACFPRGDLETTTPELWDTMMTTNVKAPFLITQAFARHVKARRARGAVVNIGSCAAHGGAPFILAYSCSKAALACFTKNTAAELRPHGIRVNQVNMGWCYTEAEDRGQSATNPNWLSEADAASPSGRILRPEDTAASVLHLLSEASAMVTGAILDISPDMLPGIMSGETCC